MAERAPDAAAGAAAPAKVMTSPPTVQKRSQPNGHASPVHLIANPDSPAAKQNEALTPPFVTEKRPQANGHASPIRLPVNSNGHADVEGYLKTDDRMRLAKERREEREKSLVAREQAIREKERRARLQYEKTVEERWRRLEEQRQKEDQRRAAVEEKRRQQLEEEKERLEAMMRKSMERSLQLEQRQKRWMWGGAQACPHGCQLTSMENLGLPRLLSHTHSSLARCHSAANLCPACPRLAVPPSPHRSPYRGSPRRRPNPPPYDETSGGDLMCPNTPKKERLRRDRRTGSPATGSPVRRAESPANLARRSASPATPKMMPKSRNQSPCPVRTYPSSPMRQRTPVSEATRKNEDKEVQEKGAQELKDHDLVDKKHLKADIMPKNLQSPEKAAQSNSSPLKKYTGSENPEKKILTDNSRPENSEKKLPKSPCNGLNTDNAESSPVTSAGKTVAGTTDAEEASRLLAERRRLARVQKELEENQRREQEEQERVKAEQLKKRQAEERIRQEQETRQINEEKKRREQAEKRQEEEQERQLQAQLDRERVEAEVRSRKNAERQRQERELQQQQEEQERQQRKKRIEEILKRTRKSDSEVKREDGSAEPLSPGSHPVSLHTSTEGNGDMQIKTQTSPGNKQEGLPAKNENAKVNENKQTVSPLILKASSPLNGEINTQEKMQEKTGLTAQTKTKLCGDNQTSQVKARIQTSAVKQDCPPVKEPVPTPIQSVALKSVQVIEPKQNGGANALEKVQEAPQMKVQVSSETMQDTAVKTISQLSVRQATIPVKRLESTVTQAQTRTKANIQDSSALTNQKLSEVTLQQVKTQVSVHMMLQPSTQSVNGKLDFQGQMEREAGKGAVIESSTSTISTTATSRPPPPLINLESINVRSRGAEESADEVQSMEVSPVSKEELISIPEFSPVIEVRHNGMSNARALEDLLDLTGHVAYPKLSPVANMGDCNKNLIEGLCSPSSDSQLLQTVPPSSHKLNIQ
ncbi:MAP7 domain-containing protein 2a isoform X3 [Denticeps clupeoides]|uniref:MAP7 domain-containing protein 2a isoform X3 n=1 Tax=Denticeps clupeoides TaxID=299321 RepID=UPI0010A4EF73|nr:MAP7 domain-containing protein 2-like isoform X3 [Denticeps clupeoides]